MNKKGVEKIFMTKERIKAQWDVVFGIGNHIENDNEKNNIAYDIANEIPIVEIDIQQIFDGDLFLSGLEMFHLVKMRLQCKKKEHSNDIFVFFLNDGKFSSSKNLSTLVQYNKKFGIKVAISMSLHETINVARGLFIGGFGFAKLS